jgi:hypothetical protein
MWTGSKKDKKIRLNRMKVQADLSVLIMVSEQDLLTGSTQLSLFLY